MRGRRPTHVKLHGAGELAPDASLLPRVCTLQWSPGSLPEYTWLQLAGYRVEGTASMEPGITPGIHGAASQIFTSWMRLQWSLGLLPGCNASGIGNKHGDRTASMELGITPGIYPRRAAPPRARQPRFNGARDYSRDTPWVKLGKLNMDVASMEPGITPGIHRTGAFYENRKGELQWSPGSFPGYTMPIQQPEPQALLQ